VPPDRATWREDLNPRIDAVRRLAVEFSTDLIPLDGLFAQAATQAPAEFWAPDGVHPTPAGHHLISQAWLRNAGIF
jgi:lysophospholipase L1-like esterase